MVPELDLPQIDAKVAAICRRNSAYAELAPWVGQLLRETVLAEPKCRPPALKIERRRRGKAFASGRSLLDPQETPLDLKLTEELFGRLVDLVAARQEAAEQVPGLRKALAKKEKGSPVPTLLRATLISDSNILSAAGQKLGVEQGLLTLLLGLALRPSLRAAAKAAGQMVDLGKWTYGHCPFCNSAPGFADLSGEGGRHLHCSLCETTWPYRRLQCPFCENDRPRELSYFQPEGEIGLRIDLCQRCGQYLKTLDRREIDEPVILHLDNAATLHLDLMASQELQKILQSAPSPDG